MSVLVTGAAGQLGSALRRLSPGFIYTDIAGEGNLPLDITDARAVNAFVRDNSIDVIINCAGYTNVDGAEDNPDRAYLLNATAVGYLADAMKERDGLLVHISTDYIFGGDPADAPIKEDARPAPLGVYGESKLRGEKAVLDSGVKHLIFRTAWLYSETGKNFVRTILNLISTRPSIKVVEDQMGTPTYAGNLAQIILLSLERYAKGTLPFGIYNYTGEGATSWYLFALAIARISGNTSCRIEPCSTAEYPTKARRPAYSVLDKTLVKETLNVSIPEWEDTLSAFLASVEKNIFP
ncbi:MAG: dTDP-4-dehydrorhamnose reductase [Bacteroidales bacterium]|nr:dTDP-4-dehydrorhamnose reductase [Bacteroidales bacterium]